MNDTKIATNPPVNFNETIEVAACYVECNNQMLFLLNAEHKREASCWGVPAGKLENKETAINGATRELFEETGIITSSKQLVFINKIYIIRPEIQYAYNMFHINLKSIPNVIISDEHKDYKWVELSNCKNLPLMAGAIEALEYYHIFKREKIINTL